MGGLSQLDLDELCCGQEAVAGSPSSPMGSALLARKRQRQLSGGSALDVPAPMAEGTLGGMEAGLSQAELDELLVDGQLVEGISSSPIGSALRCAKNRRRWGVNAVLQEEKEVAAPVGLPLSCPASWGKGGLSQADLDAMCQDEDENGEEAALPPANGALNDDDIFEDVGQSAPVAPVIQVIPPPQATAANLQATSPQAGSPTQTLSPPFSPPMRRRRAKGNKNSENNLENAGCLTFFGSPAIQGKSPGKALELASAGSLSPQRRSPCICPLSPVS